MFINCALFGCPIFYDFVNLVATELALLKDFSTSESVDVEFLYFVGEINQR